MTAESLAAAIAERDQARQEQQATHRLLEEIRVSMKRALLDREDIPALRMALAAERDRADRAEARIADAWDEGYIAVPAEPEDRQFFVEDAPNPYRSEATA